MAKSISRRSLLRGVGGVGVALPLLQIMLDGNGGKTCRAAESSQVKRYVVMFGGFSIGAAQDTLRAEPIDFVPDRVGSGYDVKAALKPLQDFDVAGEVSVVSGLKIPWAQENGGQIPAGGRPDGFHASTASPLLSGVRATPGEGEASHARCEGATSDQIVADAIAGQTTFRSLPLRAEAVFYSGNGPDNARDILSWKLDASGKVAPVPPEPSPKRAFSTLFAGLTGAADPAANARRDMLLRARKSVLDLVAADTEQLIGVLGKEDRDRLSRHLDEIRDLERRVAVVPTPPTSAACVPGEAPKDIPVNDGINYSGEEERATSLCDIIRLAFVCDQTRVASLMLSTFQSSLNMKSLIGVSGSPHGIGHTLDKATAAKAVAWHIKHFARLVSLLKGTPELNGDMLDSTALLFLCEGGVGYDPLFGDAGSVHSSENMACLVAGRVGGLQSGIHIRAPGKHPANVVISAMQAVGVSGGLGEVTGGIPELFA
jgi:Protein of unknown function (DUF1552)